MHDYCPPSQTLTSSPEERANIFSRLTFSWLNPLLSVGVKRALNEKDLYPLGKVDYTTRIGDTLEKNWVNQTKQPKPSFFKALWHSFGVTFALSGTLKLVQDLLIFVGPWLLQRCTCLLTRHPPLSFRFSIRKISPFCFSVGIGQ
jgi:hypothetical protein